VAIVPASSPTVVKKKNLETSSSPDAPPVEGKAAATMAMPAATDGQHLRLDSQEARGRDGPRLQP